jgi:protein-arginine kinase activator protein McsA
MRIDDETERAVERWVRLADELVAGKTGGQRQTVIPRLCTACGRTFHINAEDTRPLCARCYLERGEDKL